MRGRRREGGKEEEREREREREGGGGGERTGGRVRERDLANTGKGHSAKAQPERECAVRHPRIYPRITQCYAFAVRYYVT